MGVHCTVLPQKNETIVSKLFSPFFTLMLPLPLNLLRSELSHLVHIKQTKFNLVNVRIEEFYVFFKVAFFEGSYFALTI